MRKAVLGSVVAVSLVLVLVTTSPAGDPARLLSRLASGDGTIMFGDHDGEQEPVFFAFDIEQTGRTSGTMVIAAEHHGDPYPEIVIRLEAIDYATFTEHSVHIAAMGRLHDDPVFVSATAFDGHGKNVPDRFAVWCTNSDGEVLFSANGDVVLGDIIVGRRR